MAMVKSGWLHRQSKYIILYIPIREHIVTAAILHKWIYPRITVIFLQGTILRRWKKNWFDLWSDGRLVFYNDHQRRDMEDDIHMRLDCINIRNSAACHGMRRSKLLWFSALQYWHRMYYNVGSSHLTSDVSQSWTHQKGRRAILCSR